MEPLTIHITDAKEEYFIRLADLLVIEADGNYVNIYMTNNVFYKTVRITLKDVLEKINAQGTFEQHHCDQFGRSYIFNIDHITHISKDNHVEVMFSNKVVGLKISANAINDLKAAMAKDDATPQFTVCQDFPQLNGAVDEYDLRDKNGFAFVDMGLPSGTKWATRNLDYAPNPYISYAEEEDYQFPEQFGLMYSWGETYPKWKFSKEVYDFNWDDALYFSDIEPTEDDYEDGKTLLDKDDVARVAMGKPWRIPTREDWQELIDNCDWKWVFTNHPFVDRHRGVLVTSRINGKSIFLCAAGFMDDDSYDSKYLGFEVCYWSSTLHDCYSKSGIDEAYALDCYGVLDDDCNPEVVVKPGYIGLPIRPVMS